MRSLWDTSTNTKDERSISHYKSYHFGKFFGLCGSVAICVGLLTWFVVRTSSNKMSPLTWVITSLGVVLFVLGVLCFFKAVYHTYVAQSRDAKRYNNPGVNIAGTSSQQQEQQQQ